MFRSLVLQLLEGFPALQELLDDTDIVPSIYNTQCPPLNILKDLLHDSILLLGSERSFMCFIDALDECDEQQVMDLVQFFEGLAKECTESNIQLQICFSSRHYPYITLKHGIHLTLEDQPGHAQDLASYTLSHLRFSDKALVQDLQSKILDKAGGVFLWVVLVVDILNKEQQKGRLALKKRLAEVPEKLSDLFRDILGRDAQDLYQLRLCVLWILLARRPLSPKEYYHALWSGLRLRDLADEDFPSLSATDIDETITGFLVTSSKGLAEVSKTKSPVVQFIHESVRDFLLKDGGLHELWPELGFNWESQGHDELKQCCHYYIDNFTTHDGLRGESSWDTDSALLKYACQNILLHSNEGARAISQDSFVSNFFLDKWIKLHNHFEPQRTKQYLEAPDLLYVLAEKGCAELVRAHLKQKVTVKATSGRYRHPLLAAWASGSKQTVAAVLGLTSSIVQGVDICNGQEPKCSPKDLEKRTPLTWASEHNRTGILKVLLSRNPPLEDRDRRRVFPLLAAAIGGSVSSAQLLIEHGATYGLYFGEDDRYLVPKDHCLLRAIQEDQKDMVQFLLSQELGLYSHPDDWQSHFDHALHFRADRVASHLLDNQYGQHFTRDHATAVLRSATSKQLPSTVSMLCQKGADVNSSYKGKGDHSQLTPLLSALTPFDRISTPIKGQQETVEALLHHGANINAQGANVRGEIVTPLQAAFDLGDLVLVKLLIENGAEDPIHCAPRSSSLFRAIDIWITKGNVGGEPLVRHIVRNPPVSALLCVNVYGDDALTNGIRHTDYGERCRSLVKIFIDAGLNISARRPCGMTPLEIAGHVGEPDIVKLLLDSGVDLSVTETVDWN